MSAIDFILRAAKQRLEATTSRNVIYRRVSDGSEHWIRATISNPNKKNRETVHGVSVSADRRDWIVFSWSLPFEPERSDRIVDGEKEYEVVSNRNNKGEEICFRRIEHLSRTIRIHTQIVK